MIRVVCLVLVLFVAETSASGFPWRSGYADDRRTGLSVQQIETSQGQWSPLLYRPLKRQGLDQVRQSDWDSAVDTFQRMQTLVHRHEGVYSPWQFESQKLLLQVHAAMGNFAAQEQQQQLMFRIAAHAYDQDDLAMHKARWQMAQWYQGTGRVQEAVVLIDESLALLEHSNVRPNAVAVANRLKAKNQFLAGGCCASDYLEQVTQSLTGRVDTKTYLSVARQLDNLRFLEGRVLPEQRVVSSANLPAEYLGFSNRNVVLMANEPPFSAIGRKVVIRPYDENAPYLKLPSAVGWPVAVCTHALLDEVSLSDLSDMEVEVDMTVNPGGEPENVTVSGPAPNRLKYYVKRALTLGQFRPAISADGEQLSRQLRFTQRFGTKSVKPPSMIASWSRQLTNQACQLQLERQLAQI